MFNTDKIFALIDFRQECKDRKDYESADIIRICLEELGFIISDTKDGPKISITERVTKANYFISRPGRSIELKIQNTHIYTGIPIRWVETCPQCKKSTRDRWGDMRIWHGRYQQCDNCTYIFKPKHIPVAVPDPSIIKSAAEQLKDLEESPIEERPIPVKKRVSK